MTDLVMEDALSPIAEPSGRKETPSPPVRAAQHGSSYPQFPPRNSVSNGRLSKATTPIPNAFGTKQPARELGCPGQAIGVKARLG